MNKPENSGIKPINFLKEIKINDEIISKYQDGTIDPLTFIKSVGHKKILKGLREGKINYLEFLLLFGANPELIREFNYKEISDLARTTLALSKNILVDIPIIPDFDHDNLDITNLECFIEGEPHLYSSRITIGATHLRFFAQRCENMEDKKVHYFYQRMYLLKEDKIIKVKINSITTMFSYQINNRNELDYGYDIDFFVEEIDKEGRVISSMDRQIIIPKNVSHYVANQLNRDINREDKTFAMIYHTLNKFVNEGMLNKEDITITTGKGNLSKK